MGNIRRKSSYAQLKTSGESKIIFKHIYVTRMWVSVLYPTPENGTFVVAESRLLALHPVKTADGLETPPLEVLKSDWVPLKGGTVY